MVDGLMRGFVIAGLLILAAGAAYAAPDDYTPENLGRQIGYGMDEKKGKTGR